MQTNGVLLTYELANELKKLGIQVGISLDSTELSNNKNRIFHNGKGAYTEIIRGFNIIKETFGSEYANCLCVVDTEQSPNIVYNHFKSIGANNIHFLFQDYNYLTATLDSVPKIGEWLSEMFDIWYEDTDKKKPVIRPLSDLTSLLFGIEKFTEIFGKGINDVLVIETDGSIETVDTLKICGNGFTKTTLNLKFNELDDIYKESELAKLYYNSHNEICSICTTCPIENICGGGFLGHRYSDENSFDNPSVYCKEIIKLIAHIQNKMINILPEEIVKIKNISKLDSKEIIKHLYN